jgi:hypothetical protein
MTEWGNNDDVNNRMPQHIAMAASLPEPFLIACHGGGAGGNMRARIHDAFGDGGGIDYSPSNECKKDKEDDEEEEDEEGGEGGGGCPRDQK